MRLRLRDKPKGAAVNIGRIEDKPHFSALFHVNDNLVGVLHVSGHHRRHEIGWIIVFQPGGLVRHQRIANRVRFVKAIPCKLLHQVKNIAGLLL